MNLFELASLLANHESAIRASLQASYGIRLLPGGGGRTEPHRTPRELCDLVEQLPQGGPLGRAMGGAAAVSDEAQLLTEAVFRLEVIDWRNAGGSGPKPERIPLPLPAAEQLEKQRETQARQMKKERAHAARAARRDDRG